VVDKDKKPLKHGVAPSEPDLAGASHMDEFFRSLQPERRQPKPGAEAVAAAMEAAQRLAAEVDLEQSVDDVAQELDGESAAGVCPVCGHRNRVGNRFCAMCGVPIGEEAGATGLATNEKHSQAPSTATLRAPVKEEAGAGPRTGRSGLETHHYHHHYHHHHFPPGFEGAIPVAAGDSGREERRRPNAALRGEMSRAEAAVRRITHEWVLACNTKHLDDLLDLYVADTLVLRSNYPPVRGVAAVREFFFGALEAGLGDVEVEPLRLEVAGDLAYEAGRCKALVPGASGKRREERGKYLWVFARQADGEWKLAVDCWSSDLSLTLLESDAPLGVAVKTREPRKS
jgi:ketosteroid isomerase-like protein